MAETIKIGGELESIATGNKVADVANIKDKTQGDKSQAQINSETNTALADRYTKTETYNKTELDNMITTPEIAYKDYDTYADMVAETVHPAGAIYRVANYNGTQAVTNKYAEYSWDGTNYKLMAVRDYGIDNEPTAGSDNLVKSSGVQNELALGAVYDVSAKNPTAGPNNDGKWESLSVLLSDANLSTLIPTSVRKGGMSIKFVCSSDNNYIRYNLIADEFTTDVTKWAIADEGVYVENPEFAEVKLDANDKIIWAIKKDGTIFFGAGVPPQVIDYINEKIAELSLDEYEDIVAFLNGLEEGDKTLQELLNEKVDKIEGKSLSTNDYTDEEKEITNSFSLVENPEYLNVETDAEDKILGGRKADGTKFENMPQETPVSITGFTDSPEYLKVEVDKNNKIIVGTKKDGSIYILKLLFNEASGDVANVNILNLSKSGIVKLQSDLANEVLPAYWNTYIDSKLSQIDTIVSNTGNHGDLLLFFSDYHYIANTRYTPEIIKKLYNRLGRIKVFNCGDVLNTHATKDSCLNILQTYNESFAGVELYNVFGNHDNNPYGTQPLDIDDYYPLLFKPLESNPNVNMTTKGYYYVDNKVQKIRYIVLNTYGTGLQVSDTEQLNWFCSVLNDVEEGWHVVVLCHMMYDTALNQETGLHYIKKITSGYLIMAICDAFQDKQSGNYSTYNFDFTNAKGNMACILVGHIHYDYSEQSEAGYPVISILQDAIDYPGSMEDNPERKKGTYTEQAFDIISIDTVGKTVKTVRIGAGENRNFTFE